MRTTGVTTMVVPDGECPTGVVRGDPCGCKCLCAREGSPGTTKTYTCMRFLHSLSVGKRPRSENGFIDCEIEIDFLSESSQPSKKMHEHALYSA